ncbi:MAG: beta-lactamase family protein [Alphaproteobacteria bacterium]|nr:beta-lactamase family protein [Alphaproteobacteria bacterium]
MPMKAAIKEDTLIKEMDKYCEYSLEQWRVPGAAIAIVHKGEVVFQKGYGTQKYGEIIPITADTLFPIASITKAFAALSLALLVDQGKLKWNDRVTDYLPDFKLKDPWVTREFQITDLFCHRSGFYPGALEQMAQWGYNRKDIQKGFAYITPATSFRSAYAYINVPYLWIEDLVEVITGQKWGDFIKENILNPLDMKNTDIISKIDKSRLTTGHILDEETRTQIKPVSFSIFPEVFLAAGGLVSSVNDLSRWLLLQLNHLSLISKENMEFLHSSKTPVEPFLGYGGGWRIFDDKPYRVLSHGGLISGIKHRFLFIPEADAGIIVLTNLTHSEASMAISDYFADRVMGLPLKDYSLELLEKEPVVPMIRPTASRQKIDIRLFEGTYNNDILGSVEIAKGDESDLEMILGPKNAKAKLSHNRDQTFLISFIRDAGASAGEAHWGTATFSKEHLTLRGYEDFENETFVLNRN